MTSSRSTSPNPRRQSLPTADRRESLPIADLEKNVDPSDHSEEHDQFAPLSAPNYQGAGGTDNQTKPTRTFSRREDLDPVVSHHFFGGDLQNTEAELSRFASQAGKDTVIVHWEGDNDPDNPLNWSKAYRWYLTGLAGLFVLNSTFSSSAPSGIIFDLEAYFHMGLEVATLTVAIFVAGYCLGPLIWGPLSEQVGRKPVFVVAMFCYTLFNLGCALSKNTASILVFRFLAGTFAAAPLTNSGGVIADIWQAETRGIALSFFSLAPFAGPALGPIVSGLISVSGTSWRWLFYVCTMFSGVCFVLLITVKETYAPKILVQKAKRIRKETNDNRYRAPLELKTLEFKTLLHAIFFKPFIMLIQEPMLLAITIYLSFVYGVVYLLFEAYPVVFRIGHGFNSGVSGLMFLPFFLGGAFGVGLYVFFFNPRYTRKSIALKQKGIMRVSPEDRLIILMVSGPALVISFFWFGWTSYPSISYLSPMLAGSLLGFSVLLNFLGAFNYIIDVYLANAASALSANTICRSAAGAGFPMFATQMFEKLNPRWASTLLGFIALLLMPIPFIFYKYGPRLRQMSKHSA